MFENETIMQSASRVAAIFDYYCYLRRVKYCDSLKELIVSIKLYKTLDAEAKPHSSLKDGKACFKPLELGRECDLFHFTRQKHLNDGKFMRADSKENKRPNFEK